MRVLVLIHDAEHGSGGISTANLYLLSALADHEACQAITVIARYSDRVDDSDLGQKVRVLRSKGSSVSAFLLSIARTAILDRGYDLIICGHANFAFVSWVCGRLMTAPVLLQIHGIEVWRASARRSANWAIRQLDHYVSVSEFTWQRFVAWSNPRNTAHTVIPNAIDLTAFTPGPRDADLTTRYGLTGRKVLLTLARLSEQERYKGIDQVIEALPDLTGDLPDLVYVIAGTGADRERLDAKARSLGVSDHCVFTGYVEEQDKVALYRSADAFILAGWGEGFGIVLLEAMACGIPVIGSPLDATREALLDGELGTLVDPHDKDALTAAIRTALENGERGVAPGLETFSLGRFKERWCACVDAVAGPGSAGAKRS